MLFDAQNATVNSTAGTGYELIVITAVVVGGVAIFGGSGNVIGAVLGAILLQTINQALVAARISSFWDQAIAGALLLAAISFDKFVAVRAARALVAKKRCDAMSSDDARIGSSAARALAFCAALGVGAGLDPDRGRALRRRRELGVLVVDDDLLRRPRHRPGGDHGAADDDDHPHG